MRTLSFIRSAEWQDARRLSLGGSDANKIANGDPAELIALWEEKLGRREPEDLSLVLPVLIGSATEEMNRYYYERTTGRVVHSEDTAWHSKQQDFMRCTLDGVTTTASGHNAIFEAKHVNAFGSIEETVQRYMPQLHHNMHCYGVEWAVLSVIQGTQKFQVFEVELDPLYLAELIDAEAKFWACVQDGTPPSSAGTLVQPTAPDEWIEVDMTGSNEFATQAGIWLETKDTADKHAAADLAIRGDKKKKITSLVPANAKRAWGYGVECKRAKNGALTISKMEDFQDAAE